MPYINTCNTADFCTDSVLKDLKLPSTVDRDHVFASQSVIQSNPISLYTCTLFAPLTLDNPTVCVLVFCLRWWWRGLLCYYVLQSKVIRTTSVITPHYIITQSSNPIHTNSWSRLTLHYRTQSYVCLGFFSNLFFFMNILQILTIFY